MPSSRFSGLYLSGRTLAVLVVIIAVAGTMAFYRAHTTPAAAWAGLTHSDQQPLSESQVPTLSALNKDQEVLAKQVSPAVVEVQVTAHTSASDQGTMGGLPPDNPLSQFFGQFGQMPSRPHYEQGLGSGIIISPDGYIVTNNHVVQDATDILVQLNNLKTYKATVVGTDTLTDLAVIKINVTGLPNLPWGDSKTLKQGDLVFAFGNPFGMSFTMTHGIVSGKGRAGLASNRLAPQDYIQTDAAINPGNSGGPLVNVHGEVVGVNAFIYTSTGSFSGESFAIPSEVAKPISATLIAKGKVVRGYLGVTIENMNPDTAHFFDVAPDAQGALVTTVNPGEPGAKAGLEVGDIITALNGTKVGGATQLQLATAAVAPGASAKLGIIRDGKPMNLTATLGSQPGAGAPARATNQPAPSASGVRLGVQLENLTQQDRDHFQLPDYVEGALINAVTPGGPAYNAGISPGFVIAGINRHPVASVAEVQAELAKLPPDQDVLLRVVTGGSQSGATFIVVHPAPAGGGR
ncbi:MAG: Do family serine endopeptidase [Terriglobales bacterium]